MENSRPIRFRAWDKFNKQMLQHNQISVLLKNARSNTQWEYMQFTGLKDKNGKEIYERDIVKVFFGDQELIYACDWYGEVGAWVFRGNGEWLMWEDIFETGEIIGNIHENPELLKK